MVRTVLIVHAHGSETSFNSALKRVAVETLTGCGHDVIVSDLYAMNFDPVFGREDVKGNWLGLAELFFVSAGWRP